MGLINIEVSNIITCQLVVYKKKGRYNPSFCIEATIDKEFYKKYDPYLPKWHDVPYFKEFRFAKVKKYYNDEENYDDFHSRIGMKIYNKDTTDFSYTSLSKLDELFLHDIVVPKIAMKGYILWEANKNYEKEIEILVKIAMSVKETVVRNCIEAYTSPEIKIEKEI